MWTRPAIRARVDALAAEHEGAALIGAVESFAEQLDDDERAVLGDVLLDHARGQRPSLDHVRREGWLDRWLKGAERRSAQ